MKRVSIVALAFLLVLTCAGMVFAGTNVTLKWNPNTEADLVGYKIYRSSVSGQYGTSIGKVVCNAADCCTYTDLNVADGKWYWTITAYDADGLESGKSNEVSATLESAAPQPPTGLTIWQKIIAFLKYIFRWMA